MICLNAPSLASALQRQSTEMINPIIHTYMPSLWWPNRSGRRSAARDCVGHVAQMHYTQADLSLLIRAVGPNSCEHRAKWWGDVRARRRRHQGPWDSRPVAELFKVPANAHADAHADAHARTSITCTHRQLCHSCVARHLASPQHGCRQPPGCDALVAMYCTTCRRP